MPLLSVAPSKILLPRFDTLGDIVLFEGFLEALLQQFPEAKVTLLTRRLYADLSSLFPERLEWLVTDVDPLLVQSPDRSLCSELIQDLDAASPDMVLVAAHNRTWADNLVAAIAQKSKRYALGQWTQMPADCRNVFEELGLSANCPYEQTIPVLENSHEVGKYKTFWEALIGNTALSEPKLYVNEHQRLAADTILRSMNLQRKSFCFCSPAGTQKVAIKIWPGDRFAETIAWLELQRGVRCLLTGHRSEARCIESIAELARRKGANPEIWLGRNGDIPLLAAFLEAAQFYLGNDTGPMHMAAAVGTPVIGIFGGGTWPRFIPRGADSIAIAGEMSCFGCGWDCIFGDAPCMELVAVDDVKAAIDLLARDDVHGPRIFEASTEVGRETNKYIKEAIKTHRKINQDRLARLEINLRLAKALKESEADRSARLETIVRLTKTLSEVESDRAARLEMIERLTKTVSEVEADSEARLETVKRLTKTLSEVESDRAARLEMIERLTKTVSEVEADSEARLETVKRLTKTLSEVESDRAARLEMIERLTKTVSEVEADSEARLETVKRLTKTLSEVESDRAVRLETIERLTKTLSEVESDRAARLELIEQLSRTLSEVESDREARLHVIEQLDADLKLKVQEVDQFRQALKQTQDELDRIKRSLPVRILARLHLMN